MRRLHWLGRIRSGRRWFVAAAGLALGIAALFLFFPWGSGTPALELVVLGADGRFQRSVHTASLPVDTVTDRSDVVARFPLLLALRNAGSEAARPASLRLSVPLQFRLRARRGRHLTGRASVSGPLIEYELRGPFPSVEPGRVPALLSLPDTVWLDVVMPSFYCVAMGDSVPTFVSAPPVAPEALTDARIFYSLSGGDLDTRQTGLLSVRVDPSVLTRSALEEPPAFPADVEEPRADRPALSALRYVGSRRSLCGEPARPMELLTTLWETPSGGRFFVLDYGGLPRKYLFDLDRDSIIELEMWDPDGDGEFEARRETRMPIPSFLMLPLEHATDRWAVGDSVPDDSLGRTPPFQPAMNGPHRPVTRPPDTTAQQHAFRSGIFRQEASDEEPAYARAAPPGVDAARPDRPAARPPRGVLGQPAEEPQNRARPQPRRDEPPARDTDPPRRDEPARQRPPEQRDEPRLLGVPVDSARGRTPPDTSGTGR